MSALYTRAPWERGSFLAPQTQQVHGEGTGCHSPLPSPSYPTTSQGLVHSAYWPQDPMLPSLQTEMALTYSPTNTCHLLPCSCDFCLSEHGSLASHMALCTHYQLKQHLLQGSSQGGPSWLFHASKALALPGGAEFLLFLLISSNISRTCLV